ncbi:MAG: hypothetical protein HC822_20645 [Oscillochloris sp.]|nr:hypothetical protein [Oscillochloris sp.]
MSHVAARIGTIAAVFLLLFGTFAVSVRPVGAQSSELLFAFSGTVKTGPSTGTTLEGDLALTPAADGTVSGELRIGDTAIPVSGRLSGTQISVSFDLGDGVYIFGIGRLGPSGNFRGPFVGPQDGDQGSWIAKPITEVTYNFSGTVERGPSTGTTLAGPLFLRIIDNRFTGALTIGDTEIPVRGRVINENGATSINIFFNLGNDVQIFGQGTADADGNFSGSFRGPDQHDRGTWTATLP